MAEKIVGVRAVRFTFCQLIDGAHFADHVVNSGGTVESLGGCLHLHRAILRGDLLMGAILTADTADKMQPFLDANAKFKVKKQPRKERAAGEKSEKAFVGEAPELNFFTLDIRSGSLLFTTHRGALSEGELVKYLERIYKKRRASLIAESKAEPKDVRERLRNSAPDNLSAATLMQPHAFEQLAAEIDEVKQVFVTIAPTAAEELDGSMPTGAKKAYLVLKEFPDKSPAGLQSLMRALSEMKLRFPWRVNVRRKPGSKIKSTLYPDNNRFDLAQEDYTHFFDRIDDVVDFDQLADCGPIKWLEDVRKSNAILLGGQ